MKTMLFHLSGESAVGGGGRHGFKQLHRYLSTMDTLVYFIIGLVAISVIITLVIKGGLLLQSKVEEIKHSPQVQEITSSWHSR